MHRDIQHEALNILYIIFNIYSEKVYSAISTHLSTLLNIALDIENQINPTSIISLALIEKLYKHKTFDIQLINALHPLLSNLKEQHSTFVQQYNSLNSPQREGYKFIVKLFSSPYLCEYLNRRLVN